MHTSLRVLLALMVSVGLAGCGSVKEPVAGPPAASAVPGGPELVFKMQDLLGFSGPGEPVPVPLVVYADGRVIVTARGSEKALPNPELRRLTPAGLERFLQGAIAAGLTTTTDYGEPGVMDVGPTRFTVVHKGRVHSVMVEGADWPPAMQGDPLTPVRERLMAFRKQLQDLASWLGSELSAPVPYDYPAMAVSNLPLGDIELPEGFPAPKDWPFEDLAAARCVVFAGDKLAQVAKLAAAAPTHGAWKSNNKLYFVQFRPLLPDEQDCQSLPSR
ncbi:hypothetical protein Rhe02_85270 [Rhizocola hellebori]|uniref:Lipoprotein n=1 Tax=Rhizocola hellebori TaxID=1392758 RepID=A0A8J3QIS7_9ACTN|nr:hypothetical protein [Rhizocola hellebori]GIH10460.1 hypothetical protein Rhe02_85270 [Rhizocola hellebori]